MKGIIGGKPIVGFPFFVFLLFLVQTSFAQKYEIGVGLGGVNYTGDIAKDYRFLNTRPAVRFLFRNNVSRSISHRFTLLGGRLTSSDDDASDPVLGGQRNAGFGVTLIEFGTAIEYNFFDFRKEGSNIDWSPYFFIGANFFYITGSDDLNNNYSSFQPSIPLGIGVKWNATKRLNFEFEVGVRNTFYDRIDNISEGDLADRNFQFGNDVDKDSYYFSGFTVSYTLFTVPCPHTYHDPPF